MRALRKQRYRRQQLFDLAGGIAVAEHRQSERGFGDENIAAYQFKWRAGWIGRVLVVAGGDDAGAFAGHRELRRTQHMARRVDLDLYVAKPNLFTVGNG